jgi:hypothetical protein
MYLIYWHKYMVDVPHCKIRVKKNSWKKNNCTFYFGKYSETCWNKSSFGLKPVGINPPLDWNLWESILLWTETCGNQSSFGLKPVGINPPLDWNLWVQSKGVLIPTGFSPKEDWFPQVSVQRRIDSHRFQSKGGLIPTGFSPKEDW